MIIIVILSAFLQTAISNSVASTYLHFDDLGIQALSNIIISKNLADKQFVINLEKDLHFIIGQLDFSVLTISNFSTNPQQLTLSFNPSKNSLDFDLKIDHFIIETTADLKFFGINASHQIIQIQVTGSKIKGSVQLIRNDVGGIKAQLYQDNLDVFEVGKLKLLAGSSLVKKVFYFFVNPLGNLALSIYEKKIKAEVISLINQYGNSIPSEINLPAPFDQIIIPLRILDDPYVDDHSVFFNFACANDESQSHETGEHQFIHFSLSENCLNYLGSEAFNIQPSLFDTIVVAQQISNIVEINTKTLGAVFPLFYTLTEKKDVGIEARFDTEKFPLFKLSEDKALIELPLQVELSLINITEPYLEEKNLLFSVFVPPGEFYMELNITLEIDASILKEAKGWVGSLNLIDSSELSVSQEDIQDKKFDMTQWEELRLVAMRYVLSVANMFVYQKMISVDQYIAGLGNDNLEITLSDEEFNFRISF